MADCLDGIGYKQGEYERAEGVKRAAYIRQAGAIAIAILNAQQLIANFTLQRDVEDRALKISEERQAFVSNLYWPRELEFLAEFGTPEEIEDIEVMGKRYGGRLVSSIAKLFAERRRLEQCRARRYCTSSTSKIFQDLYIQQTESVTNARLLGRLIAFAEYRAREDTNYSRRKAAVSLGRGLLSRVASLYSAAGQGLAFSGREYTGALNSALEAFGLARQTSINSVPRDPVLDATPYGAQAQAPNPFDARAEVQNALDNEYSIDQFLAYNGFAASQEEVLYGNPYALSQNPNFQSDFGYTQMDGWSEGIVGNRDLARTGSKSYDFVDSDGDRGSITVRMSDFTLNYVDDKVPGDS